MPYTYFGPYGSQFGTFAEPAGGNAGTKPLGLRLVLPDQREYAYSLANATARVAGNLYSSVALVADHANVVSTAARAIGATVLSATLGATLAAIDIYSEGIVHTNDLTGEGYAFRIRRAIADGQAHAAVAASGVITVTLEPGESVQVATIATTDLTFTRNRFHQAVITPTSVWSQVAGVAAGAAAADRYYYNQTKGEAAVLADGTLIAGLSVMPSNGTAGSVEAWGVAEAAPPTEITSIVGRCIKINATTDYALIDLFL